MKKRLRALLPDQQMLHANRWLRPFARILGQPGLWRLSCHTAAAGVAVGLACGLIPGPFQIFAAALLCLILRVNLPLAVLTTLYTNPVTIVPIYIAAYGVGAWLLGMDSSHFSAAPSFGELGATAWASAFLTWMMGLGHPLILGLVVFAVVFPLLGYMLVFGIWRFGQIVAWRRRRQQREKNKSEKLRY